MPDSPIPYDDQDDDQIDRLLRDAGARMRAATERAHRPAVEPAGARGTARRWIVPVAIVSATAAAVVGAVWIAGPATETVREAPADTGIVSAPVTEPDTAPDSLPVVAPSDTAAPSSAPASSVEPQPDEELLSVTDADFDGAGGTCMRFESAEGSADGCFTHRQLEDAPTWAIAFNDRAFEITVDAFDPTQHSWTAIDDVCGYAPSSLIPGRWLHTSCVTDQYFWFEAAPRTPGGESATYVIPPRTGQLVVLEAIESALPDGYTAYRATNEEIVGYRCLVVAAFPDRWREACFYGGVVPVMLVPVGGSVFLVEVSTDFQSVETTDIAVSSVPVAGCTAPIVDMVAAIPETSVVIDGLVCAGESAMITVPGVYLQHGPREGLGYPLERAADGTWSTVGGGTTFPCSDEPPPMCAALGVDDDLRFAPLPIPPWGLIGAREHDLDPVEVTTDVRDITGGAHTADDLAAALIARYDTRTPGDGREPVVESFDALGLVVVELTLLDDSTTQVRYAVWYRPTDNGELRVERAFQINVCGRGIATPDLCV